MNPESFPLVQFSEAITSSCEWLNVFNACNAEETVITVMTLVEMPGYRIVSVIGANRIFMFSQAVSEAALSPANVKNIRANTG